MKCETCLSAIWLGPAAVLLLLGTFTLAGLPRADSGPDPNVHVDGENESPNISWKDDRIWYDGKAEWALYDAQRVIYGKSRSYEATMFTNKQLMDPASTTKSDERRSGTFEVFKHTVSEIVPTEHYDYRFLTTAFLHTSNLAGYKLATSSQEDCGTSYRQFVVSEDRLNAQQFCYFPGTGHSNADTAISGHIAFHDALTLSLRDYPFGAVFVQQPTLNLVLTQRDNRQTSLDVVKATITDLGVERITVPYGTVLAHHLRIDHPQVGGVTESHYWFAEDASDLRHVLVQYEGPFGTRYQLRKLGRWAYWDRNQPRPQ